MLNPNPRNKKYRRLERVVKGFANHRRIEMLELLKKKPELSLADISRELGINNKTASEHLIRLANAGLVVKRYVDRNVCHRITEKSKDVLTFLRKLDSQ